MNANSSQRKPPSGYLSEQDKRDFTILTGILGLIFFLAQILAPFFLMSLVVAEIIFTTSATPSLSHGAYWEGGFWFVEKSVKFSMDGSRDGEIVLKRMGLANGDEEESKDTVSTGDVGLVPGVDRLWLVASDAVGYYRDGKISMKSPQRKLGEISRPFMLDGSPAVVEENPNGYSLRRFSEGDWLEVGAVSVKLEERVRLKTEFQIVPCGSRLHSFLNLGKTVYHADDLPVGQQEGSWQPVGKVGWGWDWTVACAGSEPAIFYHDSESGHERIVGLKKSGETWSPFFAYPANIVREMAVVFTDDDRFILLMQGLGEAKRLVEVNNGQVVRRERRGSNFPFSLGTMSWMFVPQLSTLPFPFILAIILSVQMRKHRYCEYVADGKHLPFAPLWRRAVAQLVDACFLAVPWVIGFCALMSDAFDVEEAFIVPEPFVLFGFMFSAFVWLVLGLLVFGYLEGRWGRTPGKWIAGIRVLGVDFNPCGFGRGIIRNALKFVDGFFNYMVGILIVALTENWQRVGDMAARTVVVMANREPALVRTRSPEEK